MSMADTYIYKDRKGYMRFADSDKLVHRWEAKKNMGRELRPNEVVHHRDGDRENFRRENLKVMDRGDHSRYHAKKRGFW